MKIIVAHHGFGRDIFTVPPNQITTLLKVSTHYDPRSKITALVLLCRYTDVLLFYYYDKILDTLVLSPDFL